MQGKYRDNKGDTMSDDNEEKILHWARKYAKDHNYRLNPEEKKLLTVIRGLVRNEEKFGKRFCPCRIRSGDPEKDKNIVCPCIYHDKEIEEQGSCHCNLFFQKD